SAGPRLRFTTEATVAIGGAAMPLRVDGRPAPPYAPVAVPTGGIVDVGPAPTGTGIRAVLGVRGGIDVPRFPGSRATFTLGAFGGLEGRTLVADDHLPIGDLIDPGLDPSSLAPGLAPVIGRRWELGVLVGPHAEPEFLEPGGLDGLVRATWEV